MNKYALTSWILLGALLAACSKPDPAPEPVRAVKLLRLEPHSQGFAAEYAGEVRARVESRLGFRVGGKLVQRPAQLGQRVAAGQLLAQLDAQDLGLASEAAQAQIAAAQTQRDLAAADLKRFSDLKAQGFVSGAEIERRQAALDAAEASLRQAKAQAAVQGNQASYARLLADAPGVIVGTDAEVGQVVAAGTPVVRLARDGERDVVISVPEDRIAQVQVGQKASVQGWSSGAATAQALDALVREVAASADPLTRTFVVKLALPSTASLPLGATVTVRLEGASTQTTPAGLQLPTTAIWHATGGSPTDTAVWVFDPATSTVAMRQVQVSAQQGQTVQVLSGLKAGEEVVATGVHVLTPGEKVVRFSAASTH